MLCDEDLLVPGEEVGGGGKDMVFMMEKWPAKRVTRLDLLSKMSLTVKGLPVVEEVGG